MDGLLDRTAWALVERYEEDEGSEDTGTGTGMGRDRGSREESRANLFTREELREESSRGRAVAIRGVWGVDMALQ